MSVIRKKQEEKTVKTLRELLGVEGNRHCFDCGQRGPTYVNVTVGAFVCTNCSGALRKYSHRLKSISMSNFSQTEMDFIKKRGNNICKKIYYGLCENNVPPEMDIKNGMLDSHLRAKYETKKWYVEPSADLEEEAITQNQVIFDRVEKGVQKPIKSYTINSSSNIIIEPPKLSVPKVPSSKGSRNSIDLGENVSSFNTASQHKSSIDITNNIDPAKLGGGTAVKLPMPGEKNSNWLSNSDVKTDHNTQSPFGDDFLFQSANDKPVTFTPISKSQTMNFSMPPLVPMPQGTSAGTTPQGPQYHGDFKGSDKYAALAELDDLFSSTSISKQPVAAAFSPQWDSAVPYTTWYGGSNPYNVSTVATSNPFSATTPHQQGALAFNPFTMAGHDQMQPMTHHQMNLNWPGSSNIATSNGTVNPFLNSVAPVVNSSKNPFL